MRYLLTGGGTAGHVNPLLTIAQAIVENGTDEVLVLGTAAGLESRLVPAAGFELAVIEKVPFPRRLGIWALVFPFKFLKATSEVQRLIRQRAIDAVIGFGGYVSAPAYLAARRSRVPLIIHEANALPGIANRFGNRFASAAGKAFRSANLSNSEFVGMPLRSEIIALAKKRDRAVAREFFGLRRDSFTLLVTGGSLGAMRINTVIDQCRSILKAAGIQVLHIIGNSSELEEVTEPEYRRIRYVDRMDLALAASDFAISRAGAATVSELCAVGIPALYIPYPVGNGEQRFNTQDVLASGGGLTIHDSEFTKEYVQSVLIPLLSDSKKLEIMSESARETGVLDGTERFLKLVHEVVARR